MKDSQTIEYYVRGLFRGVEDTPQIREQQEELAAHIADHMADDIAQGRDEKSAFERAISSLGDLDELLDIITGRKKRIRVKRAKWISSAVGLAWGTLYMTAIALWALFIWDAGGTSWKIGVAGWMGFAVPAFFSFLDWKRTPDATETMTVKPYSGQAAWTGWLAVSLVCLAINLMFSLDTLSLQNFWAWMPILGVLTWPIMDIAFSIAVHKESRRDSTSSGR